MSDEPIFSTLYGKNGTTEVMLNFNGDLTDSAGGYTFTNNGLLFDTSIKKFGSASCTSTSDYPVSADLANSSDFDSIAITGDFTVEFFFRSDPYGGYGYDHHYVYIHDFASNNALELKVSQGIPSMTWWGETTETVSHSGVMSGNWYHIAAVKNGDILSLYLDGSLVGSIDFNASSFTPFQHGSGGEITIRLQPYFGDPEFLDDFRISSSAIYTGATYTVPAAELS